MKISSVRKSAARGLSGVFQWMLNSGGMLCVLLLVGCTTPVRDHYPEHTKKGYVLWRGGFGPSNVPSRFPIYQYVEGRMESVGSLEAGGFIDWASTRSCRVAAPFGKATFYVFDASRPVTVDVYEGKTTGITLILSYSPGESNNALYDMTFEIVDPVKGKYKIGRAQ